MTDDIMKRVKFIKSGEFIPKKRRNLSREDAGIKHGLDHFYTMKAVIEHLFGNAEFMKVKMTASMPEWRKQTCKILDALALSIKSTVRIADELWFEEVNDFVAYGKAGIVRSETLDEVFAHFGAAMTKIAFTQVGLMPSRSGSKKVAMTADWWTLDQLRSVQYVQNPAQKEAVAAVRARRSRPPEQE